MDFSRCWKESKTVAMSSNDFSDAPNEMTVRSEPAAGEQAFKLTHYLVKMFHQCRHSSDRAWLHAANAG